MKKMQKKSWVDLFKKRNENITDITLEKALWLIGFPISLKLLGHFFFDIIDAFWLGELGTDVLTAVGGTAIYIWLFYSFVILTQVGTNTLVSQNIGKKDFLKARSVANVGVSISLIMAIVFLFLYLSLTKEMLELLGLQGISLGHGLDYFIPFIIASPIFYMWIVFEEIINAHSQTHISLIIVLLCIVVNTILDPIFIYGWGFDGFGVMGAQIASVIAAIIGCFLCGFYCVQKKYISLPSFCFATTKQILFIGIPRAISSSAFCFTYIGLASLIQTFDNAALAAWMICHRLEGLAYHLSIGFSFSVAIIVGQYVGAEKPEMAKKAVSVSLRYLNFILIINSIILLFFNQYLLSLFSDDPKVLEYGGSYLAIVGLTHVFMGWELVCGGGFSGWGKTIPFLYIVAPLTISRFPIAFICVHYFSFGIHSIFWIISISTFFKGYCMRRSFFRWKL